MAHNWWHTYVDPVVQGVTGFLGNKDVQAAGLGLGGGLLTKAAYDRLLDVGDAAKLEAEGIAETLLPMTQFKPFTVTSATGGQFNTGPQMSPVTDPITGQPVIDPLTGQPKMQVSGTEATLGLSPQEQALQGMLMGQSNQFFDQSAMPTAMREADVYDRIRATQRPEEERQRLMLEERLMNQGRLGVRISMFGGTPEAFAMEQAQAEARNRASLMSIQQAQAEQAQQQQLGMSALGSAYLPQAQLLNVQSGTQMFPQMQQQAQMYGTGTYGETLMSAIEAQLIAEQKAADLLGAAGTGLLGGSIDSFTS
jgi:hypothetical protein